MKSIVSFIAGMCLLLATSASAQDSSWTVTGKVTDSAGVPLSNASVLVKNTTIGTQTITSGAFSLRVPATATLLVISSVGYESQEVMISTGSIDVRLLSDSSALAAVTVVSVGYGTLDKKEVTSAVTHLSSKDLLSFGGNNALNSIQGKVAGLSVTNTAPGDPNASPSIQLRGVSSRNAGLGPLYVINGVPGGNIDNLNTNDIESIDVLKGGAASAIYGTRGSNGVIIITTKKGSSQESTIYNGYASFDLPTNRVKVLSHDDFLKYGRGQDYGDTTDWFDAVSHDFAFNQKQTLQVSGGSGKTNYILSLDYRNANGLDLRSTKEEYGARLNLNHTSANNLYTISATIAPRFLKSNNSSYGAFNQTLTLNPTLPFKDTANPSRYYYINVGFPGSYNPVEELKTILSGTEGKYLDWNTSLRVNILRSLYTQVTLGEQSQQFFDYNFTPSYNTGAINGNSGRNSANRQERNSNQKSFEWIGNYSLNLTRHSFALLGGYSFYYFQNSGLYGGNSNFPSDVLTYNALNTGTYNVPIPSNAAGDITFRDVRSYKDDSKLIAFFGRLNYDFDKKYYLSASIRREGSSKFGYDNKWGYFPAASIGWRITNEKFFPHLSWLNELKLRADYGETGNQDFASYLSLDTYAPFGYYLYNGNSYQVWGPGQNTNYDLRWEKAKNFNVGLDFDLLKNKLTGSLNYYRRTNQDLLGSYDVPVPPNVQPTTYANVGSMRNTGFEIQLNGSVISKRDFTYSVSFAGATNNNEFLSFSNDTYQGQGYIYLVGMPAPGSPGTAQILQEGQRIGSFSMLRSAGIDASGGLLVYNKDGKIIPANQADYDNDRQIVGNGLPKFTASLGNTVTYKNFDLTVYLRGAFDYQLFNTLAFYLGTPASQQGTNVLASAYGNGKYASLKNEDTYARLSDYFLESGDFVKIDNVMLGYNFKSPVKFINSGRLYVTGRNLYTFTKWTTGDVESISVNGLTPGVYTENGGGTRNYYPSTLQVLIGLQIKF